MAFWFSVGFIQALLAVGCWIIARRRGELGYSSVVVLLLVVYLLSFLILA
jgi:hypothetical protein